ncbi:hypothetical protein D918_02709 [Trichuris suis]|nr:hypothetical protein D918_02709 [Trichuris suis]
MLLLNDGYSLMRTEHNVILVILPVEPSHDGGSMDYEEEDAPLKTPPNLVLPECLLKPPTLHWRSMKKRCAQEKQINFPTISFWEMLNALTDDEEEKERSGPVESSVAVQNDNGNYANVATDFHAKCNDQFDDNKEG